MNLKNSKSKLTNYGGHFDVDTKKLKIEKLSNEMNKTNFWDNQKESEKVINEINVLKTKVSKIETLKDKINSSLEILDLGEDSEVLELISNDLTEISNNYKELELEVLLNGEYDSNNCILEIHSGAGGTESCDWVTMLLRMYTRYAERKNYKVEVIDQVEGEEAGLKSISILIKGENAYGYLKSEKGVHRLVRISPFDSNKRRHTSFASVLVTPEINNDIEIDLKETDLKIDVYRSSGAGGQHVNTTDSAVRITHIPTKIVVTCQNERSQIKNKETALKILKSKLVLLKLEQKKEEIDKINGNKQANEFGSQIRSYVMHPYSLVKDHRTNVETSNVSKVLDGEIDLFINAYLKMEVE